MFTGVVLYGIFLVAKELDETYDVSGFVQREVYDIFGIGGKTIRKCKKKKTKNGTNNSTRNNSRDNINNDDDLNIDNSKRKLYFAFGEDLDDYGDDADDFLGHPPLDSEEQKQEEELKQILKKKPWKNRKNDQNKAIERKSNAPGNNMIKVRNKKIIQRHQLVESQSTANENFKRKKLHKKEKLRKCTRSREKRHKSRTNNSD